MFLVETPRIAGLDVPRLAAMQSAAQLSAMTACMRATPRRRRRGVAQIAITWRTRLRK